MIEDTTNIEALMKFTEALSKSSKSGLEALTCFTDELATPELKSAIIKHGVVAEYKGKYWGKQNWGDMDFGEIENATISDPKYCLKPTDKTNPNCKKDFEALSKAKLVVIRKTITFETWK